MVARPLEQMLDEVEEGGVGPLHVFEGEHGRVDVREAFEEEPPGSEQILTFACLVLADPEQLGEPGLDETALLCVEQVLVERGMQLRERDRGVIVLGDPAPHADHVCERPVGDALAVGQAPAAMPVDDLFDAVEVLVELPGEPGLADAGDSGDRDELSPALVGADVEELLDLAELPVAADERRFESVRLERPGAARDDAERAPEPGLAVLALELERACLLVGDRLVGCPAGRLADEHRARVGHGLDARGGVDEVSRDHSLARGAKGHCSLPGQDAGPCAQTLGPDVLAERRYRSHEVERGPDGPLGVVFGDRRGAPDRHDGVPDELLDRAAVELDQAAAGVEVARQKLPNLLRVARLGECREADEVGEEHGDEAALGGGRLTGAAPGGAGSAAAGAEAPGGAAAESGVPQAPQNRCPGGFSALHALHTWLRACPHAPQNR